jgi:hypothetical protein
MQALIIYLVVIVLFKDFFLIISESHRSSFNWDVMPFRRNVKILWHLDKLLGNDCKISTYITAVARQWFSSDHIVAESDTNSTVSLQQGTMLCMLSVLRSYKQGQLVVAVSKCGCGFEYLHRNPAGRRRRWKQNPVPGVITGHPVAGGSGSPGWGNFEHEGAKYGQRVPMNSDPKITGYFNCGFRVFPLSLRANSSPQLPNRFWGPPRFLCSGYLRLFPEE